MNYFAKKCGLIPKDDIDAAFADMFALQFTDVFNVISAITINPNNLTSSKQLESYNSFFNSIWTLTLNKTEERIKANKYKVIAGKEISYTDLYLSSLLDLAATPGTNRTRNEFLNIYPNIKNLDIKVRSLPRIAKWLITRPKTDI